MEQEDAVRGFDRHGEIRNAAERHVPRFAAVPEVCGLGAGAERAWSEGEVEVPRKAASEVDIVGEVAIGMPSIPPRPPWNNGR